MPLTPATRTGGSTPHLQIQAIEALVPVVAGLTNTRILSSLSLSLAICSAVLSLGPAKIGFLIKSGQKSLCYVFHSIFCKEIIQLLVESIIEVMNVLRSLLSKA